MIKALLHPSERALWPDGQTLHAFAGSSAVLVDNRKESNEERFELLEKDWVIWHKQRVLQEIRKGRLGWAGAGFTEQGARTLVCVCGGREGASEALLRRSVCRL